MDEIKLKSFLVELGSVDRKILVRAVVIGDQQLKEGRDVSLQEIYEQIASEDGITARAAAYRIGCALELMGYRGNLPKVKETFGRRMGRIRVTPKKFVKIMATKFG